MVTKGAYSKDLFRMTEMEQLTLAFDKYINLEPNPQSSFVTLISLIYLIYIQYICVIY